MKAIQPKTYDANQFHIDTKAIDPHALKVVKQLQQAGFQAYIVGGGIRDLLLGLKPKDFDIATDATPEQVKKTIRNCRIIGKRFRLAHVFFRIPGQYGQHIIEVATFRGSHKQATSEKQGATRDDGMIIRDNVYGNIDEDAIRRDFTVNALYYDPINQVILDFVDGIKGIKKKKICLIGDPKTRYQEDPVRILRALRIGNKLNFKIQYQTKKQIKSCLDLLDGISPARLFEEYIKLFLLGRAEKNFETLRQYHCLEKLFPLVTQHLNNKMHKQIITAALKNTDKRIASGKSINPAFLISTFLWQPFVQTKKQHAEQDNNLSFYDAHQIAASDILRQQIQTVSIPKRFTETIREIWQLQPQLERRNRKKIYTILETPKFRAGYDFLLLRQQAGEVSKELTDWWTKIQKTNTATRNKMIKNL